jgi:hypothetical protein
MKKIVVTQNLLLLSLLLLAAGFPATAQKSWELKKDKEGIRVYSRTSEHSRFNAIKVETILPARLGALTALLLDIDHYPQWSFNSQQAYVLKRVSPSEIYFYLLIHSPWPASDRDLVVHLRITQDAGKTMNIVEESVPDFIPPKKGLVRVPLSTEHWIVTPLPDSRIRIDYQLDLDPGAAVPAWLVNSFSTRGPFETFVNIREQLRQPKYRDATISFIKD